MARWDVYRIAAGPGYLVDVQSGLLSHIKTRIVVPLLPAAAAPAPVRDLNPVFEIFDIPHVLVPQALVSVPVSILRRPVASLAAEHDTILRAIDTILTDL